MPRRFAPRLILTISQKVKIGGVRSKKFEQISPKICRASGIPPKTPLPPACGSDPFGLDDFKFFFGGKFFSNCQFFRFSFSRNVPIYFVFFVCHVKRQCPNSFNTRKILASITSRFTQNFNSTV